MDRNAILDVDVLSSDSKERVWQIIAELSREFGDTEREIGAQKEILKYRPSSFLHTKRLGLMLFDQKNYEESEKYIRQTLVINQTDTECKGALLLLFALREEIEMGLIFIERMTIRPCDILSTEFLFALGLFYEFGKEFGLALDSYISLISLRKNYKKTTETYVRSSFLCLWEGRDDAAIEFLEHAYSICLNESKKEIIIVEHLHVLITLEKYEKFQELIETAAINPEDKRVSVMKLFVNLKLGKSSEVEVNEMDIDPDEIDSYDREESAMLQYLYAGIYSHLGKKEEGLYHITEAIKLTPHNLGLINELAMYHVADQDYKAAFMLYTDSLRRWKNEGPLLFNIGLLYELTNAEEDAKVLYKSAMEKRNKITEEKAQERLSALESGDTPMKKKRLRGLMMKMDPVIYSKRDIDYLTEVS
eukprot:GHVP01009735.1.p1 GENE.GHVP01009735.1~~GHVP01009735.1.p1  ORF type:complete len:419 (+),score=85.29 GHVP01009735.1:229-1485(+)